MDGWVNGWAHVKFNFLLKPPQPFIGLFLFLSYHFYKKFNETVTQQYVMAISIWYKHFPRFDVEYMLQNAKYMLFNMVLFDLDCTTVSKWWKAVPTRHSESKKYVSTSFNFEFYFKNCKQNYPTMSREHSGKKLLLTTKDILHKSHFKFRISEPHGLQISKFLISVAMRLLLTVTGRVIGKPNCHPTSIKLSAFLTMFMLNFVTVTIPVLFR